MTNNNDRDEDYDFVRKQLYDLVATGNHAVQSALELAQGAEHPKAFEALAKMMKEHGDVLEKLYDMQKKKQDLEGGDTKPGLLESPGTTNNIFVGSTSDLSKMLEEEESKRMKTVEHEDAEEVDDDDV